MKKLLLLAICSLGLVAPAWAQAPYTGGEGDGYDSHSFVVNKGNPPVQEPLVRVYPTALLQGNSLEVQVEHVRNKVEVRLFSLQGQMLRRSVAWQVFGTYTTVFDPGEVAAGTYLLKVVVDGKVSMEKITILQP